MNRDKHVIQIFEHQTLKIGDDAKFKDSHFAALEKYGYRTKEKYFKIGNKRIKFSNYVGVLQVKNLTIEILPKADNNKISDEQTKNKWHTALIEMLRECKFLRLESLSNAHLKIRSASLLDLYFDAFLTETESVLRSGLWKSYRNVEENLGKVKGKILFTQNIRKNYIHKEKFYVSHKIYDINNKFNQILLKAVVVLSKISGNSTHDVRIKRLLLELENVSEMKIDASWFRNLSYGRNTERYRKAVTLAKLIILNYSPDLRGGKDDVLAILFDMNRLFENYIYRKIKPLEQDNTNSINKIFEQKTAPFWENRRLQPDILINSLHQNIVIDTKWKVLTAAAPSMSDLRQMFAYNLHFDSNLSILLYPKTTVESPDKKPFKSAQFQNKYCRVAFIDLFDEAGNLSKNIGRQIYREILKDEVEIFS